MIPFVDVVYDGDDYEFEISLVMMIFTGKTAGITIRGTDAGWFLAECAVRTILLIWENRVSVI